MSFIYYYTYQFLPGHKLEQFVKEPSIPEIGVEVLHAAVDAAEVNVDPFGERLFLHVLALDWKGGGNGVIA